MFYLINGSLGTAKKASGTIYNVARNKYIKYVATPAKETFTCYEVGNDKPVAGITVRTTLLKELDSYTESVKGAGEYQSFLQATGAVENDLTQWIPDNFERDSVPKGNNTNVKGMTYAPIDVASSYSNLDIEDLQGKISSVTDAIYKVRNIKDVITESGMILDWVKTKDYKILYTRKEFMEWLEGLENYDSNEVPVGFDTETSGLLINRHKLDILVGICMSYIDHSGVYIPLNHKTMNNIDMPFEEVLRLLKPYIDSRSKDKKALLTHNGKFDWGVMKMYDIELNIVHDTLTRQAVLNIGKTGTLMKLKKIAEDLLGYDVLELEDLYEYPSSSEFLALQNAVKNGLQCDPITKRKLLAVHNATPTDIKNNMFDFRFASEEFVEIYGPADADFPRLIFQKMQAEWDAENEKEKGQLEYVYNIEIAMIPVLGEQEFYGVKVIKEEFEKLHRDTLQEMEELTKQIYAEAGQEFKIGGKDTAHIVYDVCNVPYNSRYKTKKGERSVDKHALSYYAQFTNKDGEPLYPITSYLQRYNKCKTLVSSFYSKLPKLVIEDFIFPQYNNIRAETGRLTCSNPNIQQTEPSSRKFMVVESDDYYFMICDYSQVEYRLMNGLAGQQNVIDFFTNDSEADYHIKAYSNMHGIPYAKVTSKQRKEGKQLNFGTSYGLQDKAMALTLFGDDDEASQMKAHAARAKYFAGVPKVLEYFEKQRDIAQETCYAKTRFGRRRFIPQFAEAKEATGRKKDMLIAKGRRVAGNMPVQGLAADIMKMAMIRIRNNWRKYGFLEDKARMVLNVHDEVCVQVHKSVHPNLAIKIMREAMEIDFSKWGLPPLYVGGNVGYNWKDGKADDLEAPVELMNRFMEDAEEHLTKHEPMVRLEDPREYWREEIIKYNLEILDTQSKIGYIDPDDPEEKRILPINNLDDALKSVRIAKYAAHDAYVVNKQSKGNFILGLVMLKGHEFVWNNLDYLLNNGEDFAIKTINRAYEKFDAYEDARQSLALRACAEWFGQFGGDILNYVVETKKQIENVEIKKVGKGKSEHMECTITNTLGETITFEKSNYKLTEPTKKLVGKELEEYELSLEQEVNNMFIFDDFTQILTLNADKIQPATLSAIFNLLINTNELNRMLKDKNEKRYTIKIDFKNVDDLDTITSKKLVGKFIPSVKKLIYGDLIGKDMFNIVDQEVSEIAMQIFK